MTSHQKRLSLMVCDNCDGHCHSHFDRKEPCPKCNNNGVIEVPKPIECKCSRKDLIQQNKYPAWWLCKRHGLVKRGKRLQRTITTYWDRRS